MCHGQFSGRASCPGQPWPGWCRSLPSPPGCTRNWAIRAPGCSPVLRPHKNPPELCKQLRRTGNTPASLLFLCLSIHFISLPLFVIQSRELPDQWNIVFSSTSIGNIFCKSPAAAGYQPPLLSTPCTPWLINSLRQSRAGKLDV